MDASPCGVDKGEGGWSPRCSVKLLQRIERDENDKHRQGDELHGGVLRSLCHRDMRVGNSYFLGDVMLIKNDEGKIAIRKDWGPSLISSGYSRPGPTNCRVISWDMERLQTSLLLRHRAPVRMRLVKLLRFGRV